MVGHQIVGLKFPRQAEGAHTRCGVVQEHDEMSEDVLTEDLSEDEVSDMGQESVVGSA